MESFLTSYGLPFGEFRTLVTENNSIVAGSAALALYLKQEGVNPGFEPDDLDIWIEYNHDTWYASGRVNQLANSTKFTLFLVKHGYDLTTKFDSTVNEHYYKLMTNIIHIFHFKNRNGKKVQLICVRERNLLQYIQQHFDLTACISWWNPRDNVFRNMFPGITCSKEMQIMPRFTKEERTLPRIEKYKARGFTIHETPCAALRVRDPHLYMEELDKINAFDVFAYDDVNAGEFLRQSSYHVLLYIGNQFHAYHRTQLCNYLKEHMRDDPDFGTLCELPHKQRIPHSILQLLPYSDYSIISLKQVIDNLYDSEYYTTTQWANKTPARIHDLLQQSLGPLEPLQQALPLPRANTRVIHLEDLAGLTESLSRSGLPRGLPRLLFRSLDSDVLQ
jgi:hypothetical protein